ncbi:MAG: hypothetical protein ACYSWO_27645 [Planctomycetota bacterium]
MKKQSQFFSYCVMRRASCVGLKDKAKFVLRRAYVVLRDLKKQTQFSRLFVLIRGYNEEQSQLSRLAYCVMRIA